MKDTKTLSALILGTAAACGVAEVVSPNYYNQSSSSSGNGGSYSTTSYVSTGTSSMGSGGYAGNSNVGGSEDAGTGGNGNQGGYGGAGTGGDSAGGNYNAGGFGGTGAGGNNNQGGAGQGGDAMGGFGGSGETSNSSAGGFGGAGGANGSNNTTSGFGGSGGAAVTTGNGGAGQGGNGGSCGDLIGNFTTYSQGGWNNHANSLPSELFVNGVSIGKESSDYALFTSVNAVTDFLPANGTPGALQGQYTNPTSTPAGVLAGQTLTLKLNVLTGSQACGYSLGDLLVAEGSCKGKSVSEVLNLADQALAGMTVSLSYSELNKCAEKINLNFKGGSIDNQYLKMP